MRKVHEKIPTLSAGKFISSRVGAIRLYISSPLNSTIFHRHCLPFQASNEIL